MGLQRGLSVWCDFRAPLRWKGPSLPPWARRHAEGTTTQRCGSEGGRPGQDHLLQGTRHPSGLGVGRLRSPPGSDLPPPPAHRPWSGRRGERLHPLTRLRLPPTRPATALWHPPKMTATGGGSVVDVPLPL